MFIRRLLLNTDPNVDTGTGPVRLTQIPKVSPTVPVVPKAVPDHIAKTTFSIKDFDVEQLQEQKDEKPPTDKKDESVSKEKVGDGLETNVIPDKSVVDKEKKDKVGEVVDGDGKDPKEEKSPVSFLKPPKVAADKKDDVVGKEVIKPVNVGKVTRDYTGHSAEEVTAFKKMSDEGYTFTKKLITENRELAKLKDSTYLQHEQAYVLDPGFRTLQSQAHFANKEGDFWKSQLLLMKQGKPWKAITEWDKQGNPVLSNEMPASEEAEEEVRRVMNLAYGVANQAETKAAEYPTKYKSQVTNDMQAINEERRNRFSWVADPKLMDYTIPIQYDDGVKEVSIKQIRNEVSGLFPAYMRSHPAVEVVADLMVALKIGQAEFDAFKSGKQVEEIKEGEVGRGEPSSKAKPVVKDVKKIHGVDKFEQLPAGF